MPAGVPEAADVRALRFGVFEMDLRSGEVRKSGTLLRLPPQPFQLLSLLARSEGQVLHRDHIRSVLWSDGTIVDFDQRLNSCINQIRQTLGDDADQPRYVETIPRRGYRWLVPTEAVVDTAVRRTAPLRLVPPAPGVPPQAQPAPGRRPRPGVAFAGGAFLAAVATAALYVALRPGPPSSPVTWQRVTHRRGSVLGAAFGPGREVVYAAALEGGPVRIYAASPPVPESRELPIDDAARVLGVSQGGELSFLRRGHRGNALWRGPVSGGGPREVLHGVWAADWLPDGQDLAVIREVEGRPIVEFPMGTAVDGFVDPSCIRVSRDGQRAALIEHPTPGDDAGYVVLIDRTGRRRQLGGYWASIEGLAWSPRGNEVWFTATRAGANLTLHAMDMEGRDRTLLSTGSRLVLLDVDIRGRVLLDSSSIRVGTRFGREDEPERELSWFDGSAVAALTRDGQRVLLSESGDAGGPEHAIYLRPTDGSPAVRIGTGRPTSLSADGKLVLAIPARGPDRIDVLPTGAGQKRVLRHDNVQTYLWAGFLGTSSDRILFSAMTKGGERPEGFIQSLDEAGPPRSLGPLIARGGLISADGSLIVRPCGALGSCVTSLEDPAAKPTPVPGLGTAHVVFWGGTGSEVYVRSAGDVPARVQRLDLRTGALTPWRDLQPPDPVGLERVSRIVATPDGKAYAYSYVRRLSELFVVEGLR